MFCKSFALTVALLAAALFLNVFGPAHAAAPAWASRISVVEAFLR